MINRIRSNHYNLNESLSRKGYIESARCECGAEEEDIHYVVMRGHLYDSAREKLYMQLAKEKAAYPYNMAG